MTTTLQLCNAGLFSTNQCVQLKRLRCPQAVRSVMDRLVSGPSDFHLITANVAMETLRKRCNRPGDALAVFHQVQATGYLDPDAFTYTSALAALNALGRQDIMKENMTQERTATVDKNVTQEPHHYEGSDQYFRRQIREAGWRAMSIHTLL
jgi:hypothetical protein